MYHKDVAKISTGILRLCTPLQDVSLFVSQAHLVLSSSTIVESHGKYNRLGKILPLIIPDIICDLVLFSFVILERLFAIRQRITSFFWSFLLLLKLKKDRRFLLLTLLLSPSSVLDPLRDDMSLMEDDMDIIEPESEFSHGVITHPSLVSGVFMAIVFFSLSNDISSFGPITLSSCVELSSNFKELLSL